MNGFKQMTSSRTTLKLLYLKELMMQNSRVLWRCNQPVMILIKI